MDRFIRGLAFGIFMSNRKRTFRACRYQSRRTGDFHHEKTIYSN